MNKTSFSVTSFIAHTKNQYGHLTTPVLVAVSGGVDSTTCAVLLRHVGVPVKLLFIDSGFQRQGEPQAVQEFFTRLGFQLDVVEAHELFWQSTQGRTTPESKRAGFKRAYFSTLMDYLGTHNLTTLVQGTQFYRTTTQIGHSAPNRAFTTSNLRLIEPIKGLQKAEVRAVATHLGVPESGVNRLPFPGPGLLIRFSGAPTLQKLDRIRQAHFITDQFMAQHPQHFQQAYQAFPFLLAPAKLPYINAEGHAAKGDLLLMRLVKTETTSGATQYHPFYLPDETHAELSRQLLAIPGIARVAYDDSPKYGSPGSPKPGAGIEYS